MYERSWFPVPTTNFPYLRTAAPQAPRTLRTARGPGLGCLGQDDGPAPVPFGPQPTPETVAQNWLIDQGYMTDPSGSGASGAPLASDSSWVWLALAAIGAYLLFPGELERKRRPASRAEARKLAKMTPLQLDRYARKHGIRSIDWEIDD